MKERDVMLVVEILEKAKPYFSVQHYVLINIFDTRTQKTILRDFKEREETGKTGKGRKNLPCEHKPLSFLFSHFIHFCS